MDWVSIFVACTFISISANVVVCALAETDLDIVDMVRGSFHIQVACNQEILTACLEQGLWQGSHLSLLFGRPCKKPAPNYPHG